MQLTAGIVEAGSSFIAKITTKVIIKASLELGRLPCP
jgi:hypothetical protein